MNSKHISFFALMLICKILEAQTSLSYLDTCFDASYKRLVTVDFNNDFELDEDEINEFKILKVSAKRHFGLDDSLVCVEYYVYDLGLSAESLAGPGEPISRFTLCEAADSMVYTLTPSRFELLSLERFGLFVDSVLGVHPRAKMYWDTLQLTPGFIRTDTIFDSQCLDFMRVNAEALPPKLENVRPDSIMVFRDMKPRLIYDFGMKVGDSIELVLFETDYYWQNLSALNDTVSAVLRNIHDNRVLGQIYEFSSLNTYPPVNYNATTRIGILDYPLPYPSYIAQPIDFLYSPLCVTFCDTMEPLSFADCERVYPDPFGIVDLCEFCPRRDTITSTISSLPNPISQKVAKLFVYPNPTNDKIRVNWPNMDARLLVLFDLSGKPIMQLDIQGKENAVLDLSGLPLGIYNLSVIADGSIVSSRVMVME